MTIPFNIPYANGKALEYIKEALGSGHVSGNSLFTKRCHKLLEEEWGIKHALLTSSCTGALEMSAMLLDIKPGDEVIVPSYTFVSTALAFKRQGAKIIFADSRNDNPCIDEDRIEDLITSKTKAIIPVHYAGIACEMDGIMEIAGKHKLWIIEDAAHAFGATYKGRLLGTIGHFGCFSFHETKIIHCGEGGMLSVNDESFAARAEIVWEKGTNRCAFHRGEVQKYEWIDTGSSFLMSDISAAFLLSQIEAFKDLMYHRKQQWTLYYKSLKELENQKFLKLPQYPYNSEINYSGFYFTVSDKDEAEKLRFYLNTLGIQVLSHYLDLGQSPYILKTQNGEATTNNINSIKYQDTLLRLPLYHDLSDKNIEKIADSIKTYFKNG